MRIFTFLLLMLFSVPQIAGAAVVINEIAWMGTTASASDEWIELANTSGVPIDLEGWIIEWKNGLYSALISSQNKDENKKCANTTISANGYFLLERSDDNTVSDVTADCFYTGALRNLPNGENITLKNAGGGVVDQIEADTAVGWPAGDNSTKETMQKAGQGWITASPTPRASNGGVSVTTEAEPFALSGPSSSGGQVAGAQTEENDATIRAYAGEDRAIAAGSFIEFTGSATGLKGEPLYNVRYLWSFGDGETQEGRIAVHTYRFPGTYTVGLNVSSGYYTDTDYATIRVLDNPIVITEVKTGPEGYVRLSNPSAVVMDIGGWILGDAANSRFYIPEGTLLGARATVTFANDTTRVAHGQAPFPISLRYQNTSVVYEYSPGQVEVAEKTIPKFSSASVLESVRSPLPVVASESVTKDKNISAPDEKQIISDENELAGMSSGNSSSSFYMIVALFLSVFSAAGYLALRSFIRI